MEMKYSDKGTRSLFGREMYSNVQRPRYPLPSLTAILTDEPLRTEYNFMTFSV